MTKAITAKRAYQIRNRDIQPLVADLRAVHPNADPKTLTQFVRGFAALSGVPAIVNAEGLYLLKHVSGLLLAQTPPLTDIEGILPELPSVKIPQLHLFHNPISEEVLNDPQFRVFKTWFNEEGGFRIIQIASDCQNNCLFCAATPYKFGEKRERIRFMPFPMILLLIKQLISENSKGRIMPYDNSDVMQWRDKNFDADFGDLAKPLLELGVDLTGIVTLGFWLTNPYGVEAAKKCAELGIIFELSLHLLHKTIFPTPESEPQEKGLEKYAERFAYAINVLKPRTVRLIADDINSNENIRYRYLAEFYDKRVFPMIDEELKDTYNSENRIFVLARIYYEGRAHNNPYFSRGSRRGSLLPKGYNLRIKTNGEFSVLVHTSSKRLDPELSLSQTVEERYPEADSSEFRDFLMKLRFILSDEALSELNETVALWKRLFTEFNAGEILKLLNSDNGSLDFSTNICKTVHSKLKTLPIVSQELYFKFRVDDLKQQSSGHEIGSYIYAMFYNSDGIVREDDFTWFDLKYKQSVRAAFIKEGYINENGELQPKLLRETKFFTEKKDFKLQDFYIGSIPRSKIIEIYGEDDSSWKEYFVNPYAENLVFRQEAREALLESLDLDIEREKTSAVLKIWERFLLFWEKNYILNYLQKVYFGNIEYRFLMSFEEGRNAIQIIEKSKSLLKCYPDGMKFCNYDLMDQFQEILKGLPILQPVSLMNDHRPDVAYPRREVLLGFRANTGIS